MGSRLGVSAPLDRRVNDAECLNAWRRQGSGPGLATEVAGEAVRQAGARDAELPVVAYLVEHNTGSAQVAEKVGLKRRCRAPDAGNPDPDVMRLVYSDRELTAEQLAAVLRSPR